LWQIGSSLFFITKLLCASGTLRGWTRVVKIMEVTKIGTKENSVGRNYFLASLRTVRAFCCFEKTGLGVTNRSSNLSKFL